MAIVNIPTFTDGEILTASKLNQLGNAITTKFTGAITGADMAWPLVAQGNIDMNNSYTFDNLRTLWSIVNVNEYDTFSDAVSALPSAGGVLMIPPGTTVDVENVTISKAFAIVGHGKTSVLRLPTNSSAEHMIQTATGLTGIDILNCTLDGNSATGSGTPDAIRLRNVDQVNIHNVWFKNWKGDHLYIGNDGTGGNNCSDVFISDCVFEGGSARHIFIEDVAGLVISTTRFNNPTSICIEGTPTDTNSKMKTILIEGCRLDNGTQAIDIKGASGTANSLWEEVTIRGNYGKNFSSDFITLGDASAIIRYGFVEDNKAETVSGDGIAVLLQNGRIKDNYLPSMGGDGLDMTDSQDIEVVDNNFYNATTYGIDATNSDDNLIQGNYVASAGTEGIVKDGTTGNTYINNPGDSTSSNAAGSIQYVVGSGDSSTSASGQFASSITIPAGTVQAGDIIMLGAVTSASGANDRTFAFRIGGTDAGALVQNSGTVSGQIQCTLIVTATTGAATHALSWGTYDTGAGDPAAHGGLAADSIKTVDWTTDTAIEVSFAQTGGDTVVLDYLWVEIKGQ